MQQKKLRKMGLRFSGPFTGQEISMRNEKHPYATLEEKKDVSILSLGKRNSMVMIDRHGW